MDFLDNILKVVGSVFDGGQTFYNIVVFIISIFLIHHAAYTLIGVFFTRKFAAMVDFLSAFVYNNLVWIRLSI